MHYFIFFTLLLPLYIYSAPLKVDISKLSKDPTWLKLIYFDNKSKNSTVISDQFFLSPDGKIDPKSELKATIEGYFQDDINDSSPRCRFPARYFWLSSKIDLPNYKVVDKRCKSLSNYKPLKETKSISLIFVSGYLGNPASTFGHSFLKLNQTKEVAGSDLFDISISYGALVPDNEPMLIYIYRGITGGYEAGFSDKYYYTQDLVYSNRDFRDMWNYELNLLEEKKLFLLLHIWEIAGKKFQYFFTNKNCAYMISKLLELVIDKPIIDSAMLWYAPIESFHKLKEIDKDNKLIKRVTYIPSSQRVLYSEFNSLSKSSKKIVSKTIQQNSLKELNLLKEGNKIESLDFLLSYYKYRLVEDRENQALIKRKNTLLLSRLKLPIKEKKNISPKERKPPDFDNRPTILSAGVSYNSFDRYYPTIRFSPFSIESIGQNTLGGDELGMLDITLGKKNGSRVFIDRVDFIKIKRFKTIYMPFDTDSPFSWQLNIGSSYQERTKDRYDFFIDGGVGRSKKIDDLLFIYALTNIKVYSRSPNIYIRPNIGVHIDFGKFKALTSIGLESDNITREFSPSFKAKGAYKISDRFDISYGYLKNSHTTKVSVDLKLFVSF